MKSAMVILVAGVLACAAGFFGFYFLGTAPHRELLHERSPELAWLKREFGLSDAEFTRVTRLLRSSSRSGANGLASVNSNISFNGFHLVSAVITRFPNPAGFVSVGLLCRNRCSDGVRSSGTPACPSDLPID